VIPVFCAGIALKLFGMSVKVLSRINPSETYHRVSCRRGSCEDVVVSGLSITPSDIERLARQGVPVSVPNASSFFSAIHEQGDFLLFEQQ
jgi:hypothetical protein